MIPTRTKRSVNRKTAAEREIEKLQMNFQNLHEQYLEQRESLQKAALRLADLEIDHEKTKQLLKDLDKFAKEHTHTVQEPVSPNA